MIAAFSIYTTASFLWCGDVMDLIIKNATIMIKF